jgi:hypothetical protein
LSTRSRIEHLAFATDIAISYCKVTNKGTVNRPNDYR